jgi:hypothetical protein
MPRPLIVLIFICAVSRPAQAQTVATFEDLPLRLNVGDTVTIDTHAGQAWHGRILRITPDRIVLGTQGRDVTLTAPQVHTVSSCCDAVSNGGLIGLGVGGLIAGLILVREDEGLSGGAIGFMGICGAIGMAAGIGFDAMDSREVPIYRAPRASLSILADPRGRRVTLAFGW